jgi:hypothetical protein
VYKSKRLITDNMESKRFSSSIGMILPMGIRWKTTWRAGQKTEVGRENIKVKMRLSCSDKTRKDG